MRSRTQRLALEDVVALVLAQERDRPSARAEAGLTAVEVAQLTGLARGKAELALAELARAGRAVERSGRWTARSHVAPPLLERENAGWFVPSTATG